MTAPQILDPDLWKQLEEISERIYQKGFDQGEKLGKAQHEIRGLEVHRLGDAGEGAQYLVLAGDKLGCWYAVDLEVGPSGVASGGLRELPAIPTKDGNPRVVDGLRVLPWGDGEGVAIATRGNGVWLVPLEAVLEAREPLDEMPFAQLPGSAGKEVRRLLYDPRTRELWAAAGTELLVWSLASDEVEQVAREELAFRVTAFALDRGADLAGSEDHLYLANNRCGLYRFSRSNQGRFEVTAASLETECFWQGRASVLEHLVPLSDIGILGGVEGLPRRRFSERGVFATSLRHLLVIYEGEGGKTVSHIRIVAPQAKILEMGLLRVGDWHGLAVSTLGRVVRIHRPSGVRSPGADEFAPFLETSPEVQSPQTLISGFEDFEDLPDRVYGMKPLEAVADPECPGDQMLPVVFGLGNHELELRHFRVRWSLRRQARDLAKRIAEKADSLEDLLTELQRRALSAPESETSKKALIQMIPELGGRAVSERPWSQLLLLVWDVLGGSTISPAIPVYAIQALRRLQGLRPDRLEELESTIYRIRKYVLDRESFSGKETNFLKLASSKDPELEDDRVIYRSILISRRVDPVSLRDFLASDGFGEVRALLRLPWTLEGEPDPDCLQEPADLRFLVSTYRELWLLDGTGEGRRLELTDPPYGYARTLHVTADRVLLSFSGGELYQTSKATLLQSMDDETRLILDRVPGMTEGGDQATAFASVPEDIAGTRFFWGGREGGIHYHDGSESHSLLNLSSAVGLDRGGGSYEVTHLCGCSVRADGATRSLLVATTMSADVFLLEWDEANRALRALDHLRLGIQPITALLVTGDGSRHVLVGRQDGTVVGLLIGDQPRQEDLDQPSFRVAWAFRTGDAVRAIRPVPPGEDHYGPLVAVGSHDEHLHILDLEGRPRETIYLPTFKVDLFETAPRREDDGDLVEFRVYSCAFENRFLGLRVLSRRRLLTKLNDELQAMEEIDRERRLTRWRAYSVVEGHLRHRFLRQSQRYPGGEAIRCLEVLQHFIDAEDVSDRPTGEVTALLRRLFQNRWPGVELRADEELQGTREILEVPDLYLRSLRLLRQLEERWSTPGSVENRRVQLFWIRSFLRGIEDLSMLRRWCKLGEQLHEQEALAKPENLIRHFLEHPHDLLQVKTLQYLERLVFGWPGVASRRSLVGGSEPLQRDDLEWLFGSLLNRLQLSPQGMSRQNPDPVVLQIGRLLGLLARNQLLDPLYLTYRLHRHGVSDGIFDLLADLLDAVATQHKSAERPAKVLITARRLVQRLKSDGEGLEDIVESLQILQDYCDQAPTDGPDREYVDEAGTYFRSLIPLLQPKDSKGRFSLAGLKDLAGKWSPPGGKANFYPSVNRLDTVPPLLDAVGAYWQKKYEDQWVDPLNILRYGDFALVREEWQKVRECFEGTEPRISDFERRMLGQVVGVWQRIIEEEQNTQLMADFLEIVEEKCFQTVPASPRNATEAAELLSGQKQLLRLAFSNLFTRLLLFAEPVQAAFLHASAGSSGIHPMVQGRWFADGREGLLNSGVEAALAPPDWIASEWMDGSLFSGFDEASLEEDLNREYGEFFWKVQTIAGDPGTRKAFGFYLFAWKSEESLGFRRFRDHRLAWAVPLEALVFRQAAIEQEALKGRLFSIVAHNLGTPLYNIRSLLGVLSEGFFEDQPDERREKYRELLHQARHMDGIVDGILSLSGREVSLSLSEVSLAQVVYEVVRISRNTAKPRGIQIAFPRPDRETLEQTRFRTDETKVYDIVNQLLANAIKYSEPGSEVQVFLETDPHGANIRVRDEGPGIPRAEIPLIFEPYFRGEFPQTHGVPGIGLGLYVAKTYADLLDGRLQVQNEQGGGATFTLYLPRAFEIDPESVEKSLVRT